MHYFHSSVYSRFFRYDFCTESRNDEKTRSFLKLLRNAEDSEDDRDRGIRKQNRCARRECQWSILRPYTQACFSVLRYSLLSSDVRHTSLVTLVVVTAAEKPRNYMAIRRVIVS